MARALRAFGAAIRRAFTEPSDYSAYGRGQGVEEPLSDDLAKPSSKYSSVAEPERAPRGAERR